MNRNLADYLRRGDLNAGLAAIVDCPIPELRSELLEFAFESGSVVAYSFAHEIISLHNNWESQYLASEVMATALNHLQGAYLVALFHARQALSLNPDDVGLWEYILLFHDIPEQLIGDDEAVQIAKRILTIKPDSVVARRVVGPTASGRGES